MAVPKYRISRSRRNMRRSHHGLKASGMSLCSSCGEIKRPHQVCAACGKFKDQLVVAPRKTSAWSGEGFDTNA